MCNKVFVSLKRRIGRRRRIRTSLLHIFSFQKDKESGTEEYMRRRRRRIQEGELVSSVTVGIRYKKELVRPGSHSGVREGVDSLTSIS